MNVVLAIIYAAVGVAIGHRVFTKLRSPLPWPWFQGQTKARIVFFSVAVGVLWPGALVTAALFEIPFFARWFTAFVLWKKPEPGARRGDELQG